MLIPLRWLADYVDITLPTEELARRLTTAGVEVGKIISSAGEWDGVTVAEVVDIKPHPNADRLGLVTALLATGETQTVGWGAPNVALGATVAFAAAGARLVEGPRG